jgi:hypothetical protein
MKWLKNQYIAWVKRRYCAIYFHGGRELVNGRLVCARCGGKVP